MKFISSNRDILYFDGLWRNKRYSDKIEKSRWKKSQCRKDTGLEKNSL